MEFMKCNCKCTLSEKTLIGSLGMVAGRLDHRLYFFSQHRVRLRSLLKSSRLVKGALKSQWWWGLGTSGWDVTWNIANTYSQSSWLSIWGVYVFSHVWLFVTAWTVSLPGSSVCGILQATILEWVSISYSWGSSRPKDRTQVSCSAGGFFTSWATREAQESWRGLPFAAPADLPNPGIEPTRPALAGRLSTF